MTPPSSIQCPNNGNAILFTLDQDVVQEEMRLGRIYNPAEEDDSHCLFINNGQVDETQAPNKKNGSLLITLPFVWDEHEIPFDFARYTSFGIIHLLERHGFKIQSQVKSTTYIETVFQMLTAYISQVLLPENSYMRIILGIIIVSPINILGIVLGKVLPNNTHFYHNNIVLCRKLT